MKKLRKCNKAHGKIIIPNEVEAMIILARRQNRDKGEKRYYPCGKHFHLTSQDKNIATAA